MAAVSQQPDQPLRHIKDEKRNVEKLKLLAAMYQFMVKHPLGDIAGIACEDQTKKSYRHYVSLWEQLCGYYLGFQSLDCFCITCINSSGNAMFSIGIASLNRDAISSALNPAMPQPMGVTRKVSSG